MLGWDEKEEEEAAVTEESVTDIDLPEE